MPEEFVGQAIRPVPGDVIPGPVGAPLLPRRFTCRGREHSVAEVLETWKTTGPCTSGSDEEYVRKHWFRVRTTDGAELKLYFERQPRSTRERGRRWWLYTISEPEGDGR